MPLESFSSCTNGISTKTGNYDANISHEIGAQTAPLQKTKTFAPYLPFRERLIETQQNFISKLKSNLAEAILAQGDSLQQWLDAFNSYMTIYGYAFTKEDHVQFIHICLKSLVYCVDNTDFGLAKQLAELLNRLLVEGSLLTPKELVLDWRIFHELLQKTSYSAANRKDIVSFYILFTSELHKLVINAKIYFPPETTAQLLSEWREHICTYDSRYYEYMYKFIHFLPTLMPPELHEKCGLKLWFQEFIQHWIETPNKQVLDKFFVRLFSDLALHAGGLIDWSPYVAIIFERFNKIFSTGNETVISNYALWVVLIISPSTPQVLQHLNQFLHLRSTKYFISDRTTPDKLFQLVLSQCLKHFVNRLRDERYEDKKWFHFALETHKITDDIIRQFSSIILEWYDKIGSKKESDFVNLYRLCLICPDKGIIAEKVMYKLRMANERIYEPGRMNSALELFASTLFPIVTSQTIDKQNYRFEIIPLLSEIVESMNTNETFLCYLQMFTIWSIVNLDIPLDDCSRLAISKDLRLNSRVLQSAKQLKNFPGQFVQCCFRLIESENEELLQLNKYKKTLSMVRLVELTLTKVLVNSTNHRAVIDQLHCYADNRLLDSDSKIEILASMMKACFSTDAEYAMSKFLPSALRRITSILKNVTKSSQICESEFMYNFKLLIGCIRWKDGTILLPYQIEIIRLFEKLYQLEYEHNSVQISLVTSALHWLFDTLTEVCLVYKSDGNAVDENCDKVTRFMNWPPLVHLDNISPFNWHIPSVDEINFTRALIDTFIKPQIASLDLWANYKCNLSKSELEKCISFLASAGGVCTSFVGPEKEDNNRFYYIEEDLFALSSIFDQNDKEFRNELVSVLQNVITRLRDDLSDNVSIFTKIIGIFSYLLFPFNEFYQQNLETMTKKMYKPMLSQVKNVYIPMVHYHRMGRYYSKISSSFRKCFNNNRLTAAHKIITVQLFQLSTCSTSKIRTSAQQTLFKLIDAFPQLVDQIIPKIVENLKNVDNYSAFKGSLFVLIGRYRKSILLSTKWNHLAQVFPALVAVNYAEKPEIAKLFDTDITDLVMKHFESFPIRRSLASKQFEEFLLDKTSFLHRTIEQINNLEQDNEKIYQSNECSYRQLIDQLVKMLTEDKVHWRFYHLGFRLLIRLIQKNVLLPDQIVSTCVENLIHESEDIRMTSVTGMIKILFLIRPQKKSIRVDSHNVPKFDSIPFEEIDCSRDEVTFQNTTFYDNLNIGYYGRTVKSYTRKTKSAIPTDLLVNCDQGTMIKQRFGDPNFLDRIFELYSIESSDNDNKLDSKFIRMWKYLFQSLQLEFIHRLLFPRIEQLLTRNRPNYDKLAVEIMCAMFEASSSYDYANFELMKQWFCATKIFTKQMISFNSESYDLWLGLIDRVLRHRDIRRYLWVFDALMENIFTNSKTTTSTISPYYEAANLDMIFSLLFLNWKFTQISSKVLTHLEQTYLAHEYQNVRLQIARLLRGLFPSNKMSMSDEDPKVYGRKQFIQRIVDKLHQSMSPLLVNVDNNDDDVQNAKLTLIKSGLFDQCNDDDASVKDKKLLHLIDTISHWIDGSINEIKAHNLADFVVFFPYLCSFQSNDQSVHDWVKITIGKIAKQIYTRNEIDSILVVLVQMSTNWNWVSREMVLAFMHSFVHNNAFMLSECCRWRMTLIDMVVGLLYDRAIEVREAACIALSSLIAWNLMDSETRDKLIAQFKSQSDNGNKQQDLTRHGAILGLCAFVYAFPDDLPKFLPDVLLYLARHLSDRQPISSSITKALSTFKRLHADKWFEYERQFSPEQLAQLMDIFISPSYYV